MRSSMANSVRKPAKSAAAVSAGGQQAGAHAAHKTQLVQAIAGLRQTPRAGFQIERRGNRAHGADQGPRSLAQFPGQLQGHVAAQGKTGQEHGAAPFLPKDAQHRQKVAGETGMVKRAAKARRAAAGAHVKTVGGESGAHRGRAQAAHIAGFTGTLQAVDQDDLPGRGPRRALRFHQHLGFGIGAVKPPLHRGGGARPGPEVARDGLQMGVPEQRLKRGHRALVLVV